MGEAAFVAARDCFADALRLAEESGGPASVETVEPLLFLAKALLAIGDQDARDVAEAHLRRALVTADAADTAAHRWLEDILKTLGLTCSRHGRPGDAIEYLERALMLVRARGGDARFELTILSHTLLDAARPIEALRYAEEILAQERASGVAEEELLGPLIDVGISLREAGRRSEALAVFRTAHVLALSRKDVPDLRAARINAANEIRAWIEQLEAGESDLP